MNKIKHYMIPEHINELFKNEAISSISLTREMGEKLNEVIDMVNEYKTLRDNKYQEQDGKIDKAIIYLKHNLKNTLMDLLEIMKYNGELDEIINEIITESIVDEVSILKNSVINVKSFGVFGTGSIEETTKIQQLINQYAGKKALYFPNGTYLIGQLRLKRFTEIIGESKTHTIFKSIDKNKNNSLIYGEDLDFQHSVIKNVTIDGNKENNTTKINGIYLKMISEPSYELVNQYQDLIIQNCTGTGLVLEGKQGSNLFIQVRLKDIFSHNNEEYGFNLHHVSDSYIQTCEACQNKKGGFHGVLYSTKISSCKAWFNGFANNGNGFEFSNSTRVNMVTCESQDNWGHGFNIKDSTFIDLTSCDVDNNGVLADEQLNRSKRSGSCEFSGVYFNNVTRAKVQITADNFLYGTYGYMQKSALEIIGGNNIVGLIKSRNQEKTPIFTNVDLTNCEFIIDGVVYDKSISADVSQLTTANNYSINTTNSMNRLTKKNNHVHLQCVIEHTTKIDEVLTTIFTLPEEYRPKNAISYACFLGNSAYNFQEVGNLLISVNGTVAIRNTTSQSYKFASICVDYDV